MKCTVGPGLSKKNVETNKRPLCIQSFTEVSHLQIWQVWIHCQWLVAAQNRRRGRMQETKKTSSGQTTVQEMMCRHQQKLHTRCIVFGESVLQSLTWTTWADVNKIKASKCHSVPVLQCICMIENVNSRTLLTRWMTEKMSFDTFFLFWLIVGASAKNPVKNLKIRTWAVWSTDRSILG